ncbi:MAG: phosphatidylglycerophosphatase A [Bacteroidetes bacterium]|nr:MAG: phosphatidylglycerophosphatase A [Bacteroidota bacterium]
MLKLHKIIASGLGTGYAPLAPGTAGSILGILLFYLFNYMLISFNIEPWLVLSLNLFAIIFVLVFGVYSIKKVHAIWEHDASIIVIDEIVGVWIAVFAMPLHWQYYLYALLLFRFFDIVKPLYIRRLDNMGGDWSVMLDDVLAGIYSLIVLQALLHFSII